MNPRLLGHHRQRTVSQYLTTSTDLVLKIGNRNGQISGMEETEAADTIFGEERSDLIKEMSH